MFQVFFHLQYIFLTVEDLTGANQKNSRFPGFDYLVVTIPFAFHHISQTFYPLTDLQSYVKALAIAVILYGSAKLMYIVYSMLAQTFAKLGRPSYLFNLDKKQLRAPWN